MNPPDEFRFMANVYAEIATNAKGKNTAKFWPNDESVNLFECSIPSVHDPKTNGLPCIRLTTLHAHDHKNQKDRRILTSHDTWKLDGNWDVFNDDGACSMPFFEKNNQVHHDFKVLRENYFAGNERTN